MAHWTKTFRRYERHFLLVLVILLLASFSITGALNRCGSSGGGEGPRLGGSFAVVGHSERVTKTDVEMNKALQRYRAYMDSVHMPTLDFASYLRLARSPLAHRSTWMHVILSEAAERAGYRCGPGQLANAVRTALGSNQRTSSLQVTPELYERFLTQIYGRPASEFEQTLREIVIKDELLSCFVDPIRFHQTYEQAFEEWKSSRERVDLRYLAAEGASFAAEVRAEELSRREMSKAEEALRDVSETVKRLRTVAGRLADYKKAKSAFPDTLAVLAAKESQNQPWSLVEDQIKDAWEHELVYTRGETDATVSSLGPDGQAGTADDVTPALQAQLDTHRALAGVAQALVRWRSGAEPKAWPEALANLTQAPPKADGPGASLPPLTSVPKDGWGHDLVYTRGGADAAPTLVSAGPDGEAGNADDVKAEISAERGRVGPGPALASFVPAALVDAWGHPITSWIRTAEQGQWESHSAGKDGEAGTTDDILGGNRGEIVAFYARSDVRTSFLQPMRRRFKALVMHLPLVSEATLKRLWADFPHLRPSAADEEGLFELWRNGRGTTESSQFHAVDPRDPEKGHGAALAKRMGWKPEALLLVPPKSVFDVPPAPPAAPPEGAPPAPAPAPAPEPAPAPSPDPEAKLTAELRKEYEEKGWREVLLRQDFLERVLNEFWQEVVKSRQAVKEWEKLGQKVTPRPIELGVEDLLAEERLGKYQPGEAERALGHRFLEFYGTDKPDGTPTFLTAPEIEALPEFGDVMLPVHLGLLKGQDVSSVPIQLNLRHTKVVAQNLELKTERVPELSEVADEVFERFLVHKALERAERELGAFERDVQKRIAELKEGESDDGVWAAALEAWKQAHPDAVVHDERTGLFIGSRVPTVAKASEDAEPAQQAALRRRNFVRQGGYGLVRAGASKQDSTDAKPGTFGRSKLRDDSSGAESTGSAYVVRVAERVYPTPAEFSPRAYAEHLAARVFGERRETPGGTPNMPVGFRKGLMSGQVALYFEELERLQALFDLRTNTNLDQPPTR